MRPIFIAGLAAGVLAWSAMAQAQAPDAAQVRGWAATCATCHGTDGRSEPGGISIAGNDAQDMLQKLLEYKNGTRPATVMHQIAQGYTDDQLAAIAGWFAAQKK